MEFSCRKISIIYVLFIIAIILYAVSISMYALLNGSNGVFNIYNVSTTVEVKSVAEREIGETEIDNTLTNTIPRAGCLAGLDLRTSTIKSVVFHIYNAASDSKVISRLSCADISNSIYLKTILFMVFTILCSNLFIALPNDLTLLNQKVRLND